MANCLAALPQTLALAQRAITLFPEWDERAQRAEALAQRAITLFPEWDERAQRANGRGSPSAGAPSPVQLIGSPSAGAASPAQLCD